MSLCLSDSLSLCETGVTPGPWGAALMCKSRMQDLGRQTDELDRASDLPSLSLSFLTGGTEENNCPEGPW